MAKSQRNSLAAYRRRLRQQGVCRLEVRVRRSDAELVREVANALTDPAREDEARALLRDRFAAAPAQGLKALLAAAPLEGIELTRDRGRGRKVEL